MVLWPKLTANLKGRIKLLKKILYNIPKRVERRWYALWKEPHQASNLQKNPIPPLWQSTMAPRKTSLMLYEGPEEERTSFLGRGHYKRYGDSPLEDIETATNPQASTCRGKDKAKASTRKGYCERILLTDPHSLPKENRSFIWAVTAICKSTTSSGESFGRNAEPGVDTSWSF